MIVLDIMGLMVFLAIQINAISVVNLVMSIGIIVEFCVYITHAFSVINSNKMIYYFVTILCIELNANIMMHSEIVFCNYFVLVMKKWSFFASLIVNRTFCGCFFGDHLFKKSHIVGSCIFSLLHCWCCSPLWFLLKLKRRALRETYWLLDLVLLELLFTIFFLPWTYFSCT